MSIHLPDYRIGQQIFQSDRSAVYRAHCLKSDLPVIVKTLNEDYPEPSEAARFKYEYRVTRQLTGANAIITHGLLPCGHAWAMVLEDAGTSLDHLTSSLARDRLTTLRLALRIVDALGEVHADGIIHKDINPSNIVWNRETDSVKIIDFGICSQLRNERLDNNTQARVEGTPAYMAPEQSGRVNRAIDYRSDLYSLGATLFELFTGRAPFTGRDMLELVHAHIARSPEHPCDLNPALPRALGDLILKLMAKPAEDRYQSLFGLRQDLAYIEQSLRNHGEVADFALARHERFDRLQIPEKLYGREPAIKRMQQALDRCTEGAAGALFIHGPSGIGKSALVREMQAPVARLGGHFLTGKCDQLTRVPYAALLQALRPLLRHVSQSPDSAYWRGRLEQALDDDAGLLVGVLPELARLMEAETESVDSGSIETENRFFRLMRRLIGAFCDASHPLVLFLDDLQWADGNTLKLIRALLQHPDTSHLVVLGAYRDNEIEPSHPLQRLIGQLQADGSLGEQMEVTALGVEHIAQLLADSLHLEVDQTHGLAETCLTKTGGNPFFLAQFLHTLSERKLLRFDPSSGHWRWSPEEIDQADITDNVVTLMVERLRELSANCQRIVQYAACIGATFDLRSLAVASGASLQQAADDLWPAVSVGLLVPMDSNYRLSGSEMSEIQAGEASYRFLHDRVQQAAYAMLDKTRRQDGHRKIGRRLLQAWRTQGETNKPLFDAVNHLNLGNPGGNDAEQVDLNRLAGNQARASGAFEPAYDYFRQALDRLSEQQRGTQQHLSLLMQAAECAFLSGAIDQGDRLIAEIDQLATDAMARSRMYHLQVRVYTLIGRIHEALDCALDGLAALDIHLPTDESDIISQTQTELGALISALPDGEMNALLDRPSIVDERILLQQQLLTDMGGAAYTLNARLYVLAYLKLSRLAVDHGNSPWSAYGYATMASTLARMGDYQRASTLGQVAQQACFRFNGRHQLSKVRFIVGAFVHHWQHSFGETRTLLEQAFDDGLRSGDLLHANYALMFQPFCHWYGESPLTEVVEHADRYLAFSRHTDTAARQATVQLARHAALNLCGKTLAPDSLSDAEFDEAKAWETVNAAGAGICRVFKLQVLYCRGHYQAAADLLTETEPRQPFFAGMVMEPGFVLFAGLTLCQQAREQSADDAPLIERIEAYAQRLETWATLMPRHYQHRHDLLRAEMAAVQGQDESASRLYGQAIRAARGAGFVATEALACELAAAHYRRLKLDDPAASLLSASYRAWRTWGATALTQALRQQHPNLERQKPRSHLSGSITGQLDQIDATAAIRACQAIASEIQLDSLLRRFMQIIIENAGARRGALLLDEGTESLQLAAIGRLDEGETALFLQEPAPDEIRQRLPDSLICHVARSGQTLIKGRSQDDSILRQHLGEKRFAECRSLLCLALLNQQRLVGVLLLENRLVEGVFKPDQITVLEMLAAQAAMSILNARLYSQMEAQVRTRTKQLREKADQLESANQLLERLSITDSLTRLNNRRFLESRIENDVRQAIRLSMDQNSQQQDRDLVFFLIDLDHFKQVNDQHGHDVGDRVLRQIARVIDEVFRETDYRVRWGGEEFLAVARFCDRRQSGELAERLRTAVAATSIKLGDGNALQVTCSIGFAALPFLDNQPDWLGWQQVLRLADVGMYLAKTSGRNAWVGIEPGQIDSLEQRQWLLDQPQQAFEQGWLKVKCSFEPNQLSWQ